jgi:hypothetical protein
MSGTKSIVSNREKQPDLDHRLIADLTDQILGSMRLALLHAEVAALQDQIKNGLAFEDAVEEFVGFAKDTSNALKKLKKARKGE